LGWKPLYAALPQVAGKRAAKMLSLTVNGTPSSADNCARSCQRRVDRFAASRAAARSSAIIAFIAGLTSSMRAWTASRASEGVNRPSA
jgi:hypothetical protein